MKNNKITYIEQTKSSANCGPCSLKMLLDFHKIKNNKKSYSVQSLSKHIKVTKKYGCDEENITEFLALKKINYKLIKPAEFDLYLCQNIPILCLFMDEETEGHYSILFAQTTSEYIFHDPWPDFGKDFKRDKKKFLKQAKVLGNWFLVIAT